MIYLLHHTIDVVADKRPQSEAVRFRDEALTYADLVERSTQLARCLRAQGVRRNDRVGIYMHKCVESAIAIYGIMKSGATYVPLDPLAPSHRTLFVISDCSIRHIVTHKPKLPSLRTMFSEKAFSGSLIGIDGDADLSLENVAWREVFRESTGALDDVVITEQDLSYIMYTSGSTGDPKGIMHTHHSGLSYARWAADEYGLSPDDRLTNHAPLHFDLSTFDFFAGALAGSSTVIVPEEYMKFPADYSQLLADELISVFFTVPFALIQLLLRGALEQRDHSALRWVIFGGEPLSVKYLQSLMNAWPNAAFSNMYGPAETNGCTFYHVPRDFCTDSNHHLPIGRICRNMHGLIIDENDDPVPPCEIGELVIRSPTTMQGYWRRPELNLHAFLDREIHEGFCERYYRTGDMVQDSNDGNLRFIGRKDRQVKIRGYRIELDEIEAALVSHASVEEAAVYDVPDGDVGKKLEAAIIMTDDAGPELTPSAILLYLKQHVPAYAVPGQLYVRAAFPRTSSGKIDRRALRREQANLSSASVT